VTDAVLAAFGVLGVAAHVLLAGFAVVAALRVAGVDGPWRFVRETLAGSELWLAAAVAAVATGGSLYFSEVADFVPCKLCWFQRIAMYPLVLLALPALAGDRRAGRYFLPLPLAGLLVASWHILVERGVVEDTQSCRISAPGGCATRWMEELGYVTIPTLAATGFALVAVLLALDRLSDRGGR
jgi:disulfide bond formation protein DsbB